jgi:hypothetical protein
VVGVVVLGDPLGVLAVHLVMVMVVVVGVLAVLLFLGMFILPGQQPVLDTELSNNDKILYYTISRTTCLYE